MQRTQRMERTADRMSVGSAPAPGSSLGAQSYFAPGTPAAPRAGDEIVVAGTFFHTGTKVVTWLDPGGFNAYACTPPLPADTAPGAPANCAPSATLPAETPPARPVGATPIPVPRYSGAWRILPATPSTPNTHF